MPTRRRRGAIVVMAAFLLVMFIAVLALSLDVGYMQLSRADLQHAADAAVLAGVAELPNGQDVSTEVAQKFAVMNAPKQITTDDVEPTFGIWNNTTHTFSAGATPYDAMQVTIRRSKAPLFFGRVMGHDSFDVAASATAIFRPRDIMLVLDFSGSMNSQKKIQSLKEAVDLFFSILDGIGDQDQVGFVRYSTQAELAFPLTNNYTAINDYVQKEKADGWTNIGDGMNLARSELENNGRRMAHKMMVIMTDGNVNKPANKDPRGYVLEEAQLARDAGIQLITISFGTDADKNLMIQVAEIGNGTYFNVEGGVGKAEAELREVFEKIATRRPVVLVD
ncbi:MAG: VWA domain-containing protein [Planctomycetales bacterium]|nr:VWA domain-containing protein [Planctomycetales bacterium]